jgi:hypothetical protein
MVGLTGSGRGLGSRDIMLRGYILVESSDPIGPLAFVRTLPRAGPGVSQRWYHVMHVTPPRDLDSVLDDDNRQTPPLRLFTGRVIRSI